MPLRGKHVVVDGSNLELTHGTGIRSYGQLVIRALHAMRGNVSVLFSRRIAHSKNPVLNESLFFDEVPPRSSWRKSLRSNLRGLLSVYGRRWSPKQISLNKYVVKGEGNRTFAGATAEFIDTVEILNLPDCYRLAHRLSHQLNVQPIVSFPNRTDLFHLTCPHPIRTNASKQVVTIHDIIPLKVPYTTLDRKKRFYSQIEHSIRHADLILTDSEASRHDILATFEVRPEKVVVNYLTSAISPPHEEDGTEIASRLRGYQLLPQKYFLFVGAIEPRKNLRRLINAYARLDTDVPLVIAGPKGWLWEDQLSQIDTINCGETNVSKQRIRLLGHIPKCDLPFLYAGAVAFTYPSIYEGFGLPPLEAMKCGCPVLTSNLSSLPEVCGEAALYVDPFDVSELHAKLEMLISDEQLRNRLADHGRCQASKFSFQRFASSLYSAYSQVLDLPPISVISSNLSPAA